MNTLSSDTWEILIDLIVTITKKKILDIIMNKKYFIDIVKYK